MFRESVETNRDAENQSANTDDVGNNEEDTNDFLCDWSTNDFEHVDNRMTTRVPLLKVSLHDRKVRIQCSPLPVSYKPREGGMGLKNSAFTRTFW